MSHHLTYAYWALTLYLCGKLHQLSIRLTASLLATAEHAVETTHTSTQHGGTAASLLFCCPAQGLLRAHHRAACAALTLRCAHFHPLWHCFVSYRPAFQLAWLGACCVCSTRTRLRMRASRSFSTACIKRGTMRPPRRHTKQQLLIAQGGVSFTHLNYTQLTCCTKTPGLPELSCMCSARCGCFQHGVWL